MTTLEPTKAGRPPATPYVDAPKARDYVLALGRIYLEAGLPLSAAFEAAFADYHALGAPAECET
jgi:hypothetical protein